MKARVNLTALKINGHDPRFSKAFQYLSESLSHKNVQKISDWDALELLCYQQFHDYGYDLQTGVWFCLINSHLKGWGGLLQSLELLTGAWENHSARCWPPLGAVALRQNILEWFSQHVATLMYTMPITSSDITVVQRIECVLRLLSEQAKVLQARCDSTLENVRYFLQVRTHSVVAPSVRNSVAVRQRRAEESVENHAVIAESVPFTALTPTPALANPRRPYLRAALLGGIVGVMVTSLTLWLVEWSCTHRWSDKIQMPIGLLQRSARAPIDMDSRFDIQQAREEREKTVPVMREQLLWLATRSPEQWMMQGERLSRQLEEIYPGNPASASWQQKMQEKAGSVGTSNHWKHGMVALAQLEGRLQQSEKAHSQYLTISELKTAIYQIQQDFEQQGEPVGDQLNDLQQDIDNRQDIHPAALYQIQEQINALLAKYTLLKTQSLKKGDE